MKVLVYPADQSACGSYRLIYPSNALKDQGADVTVDFGAHWTAIMQDTPQGTRVLDVTPPEADVVVIQRPLNKLRVQAIEILQSKGIAVVVEIDDDFSCIPPSNAVWASHHPRANPASNWRMISEAVKRADLVTISTPALAERYGPKCVILPNYIPESYLKIDKAAVRAEMGLEDKVRIGWTGIPATHGGDLEVCGDAVARVCKETGATFRAIGSIRTLDILGIPEANSEFAPWSDLAHGYPRQLATLDVGIAPLADTAFNRAKSWLKVLEYMALGVPSVASPLPEYQRLSWQIGGPLMTGRSREWAHRLGRLARDEEDRMEMASFGRETAANWTVEGNCERWWDAWETALQRRRAA